MDSAPHRVHADGDPRLRLAALAALLIGGTAHADDAPFVQGRGWEWRITIANDAFTELTPPLDDQGFTTDLGFAIRHWFDPVIGGISFRHRTVTERTSLRGGRRWDLLELFTLVERPLDLGGDRRLLLGARCCLALGGNFGGRWIQNGWHELSGTGPTLDDGLQRDYDGDRRIGLTGGGFARASLGPPALQLYAIVDGQLAARTGVTSFEAVIGGRIARPGRVELGAHAELGAGWYHVPDPNLELPGGYGTGGSPVIWRAGLHVAWHRFRVAYTYRANEGGSGEPIGTLDFIAAR